MKKLVEIKHYKDLVLPLSPEPNSVYYILEQSTNKVKTFITDKSGFPIPLVDLTGGVGGVVSVTGTGVTGTITNPIVDIATFISQQIGNRIYLSLQDGKLNVNPITSPNNTISVTSTPTELQLKLSDSIASQINSALQIGDNISSLTNDAGYITLLDIPAFDPNNYDLDDFNNLSLDPYVRSSQVSDGETNLGYLASPTNGLITSDTGTDATIPLATNVNSGLLSPGEKQLISGAAQSSNLALVATTGSYTSLLNTPTSFPPSTHTHPISQVVNLQITLDGKENIVNKQNSLAVDGTGIKYPTVDAVSGALANKADLVGGIIPTAQIGSTTNVTEGNNLYFTTGRVLTTLLSGLSLITGGVISATDNILVAFGKLQKQITDLTATVSSNSTAIAGKEDTANKSQTVDTDQASTTKYPSVKALYDWAVGKFQNILVSGTNIKTINGNSILGSGNLVVPTSYSVRAFYPNLNLAIVNIWYSFTRNTSNILTTTPSGTYGTGTVPVDSSGNLLADVNYVLVSGVNKLKRVSFSTRESIAPITIELYIRKFDLVEGINGRGSESSPGIIVQESFATLATGSNGIVKTNFTILPHTLSTNSAGIQIAFRSTSGTTNLQGVNLILDFE